MKEKNGGCRNLDRQVVSIAAGDRFRRCKNHDSLIKEVGRGKRGARDLTYEEAPQVAESILGLQATPAQIGAFFIAGIKNGKRGRIGGIRAGLP